VYVCVGVSTKDIERENAENTAYFTRKETTDMNFRIIITAGLGVPLSTGPSTVSIDVWFSFHITSN